MKQKELVLVGVGIVVVMVLINNGGLGSQSLLMGVVGLDCDEFRTNVASLSPASYTHPDVWIAADCDNNGEYEAYGSPGGSFTHQTCPSSFYLDGQEPVYGYDYYCLEPGDMGSSQFSVYVYNGEDCSKFQIGYGTSDQADIICGTPPCTPSWQCTPWSDCPLGSQQRTCTDANACGTNDGKPTEQQECSIECPTCDANVYCSGCSLNTDGLISRTELGAVITKWISS